MDSSKREKLERAGWKVGDAEEFLDNIGSFSVVYLPVDHAWAIMFGDSVLRIFNSKEEAEEVLDSWSKDV